MSITFFFKKYEASQKELWDEVNRNAKNTSFLSSGDWIEFQKTLGKETDQYLIYVRSRENDICVGNVYIEVFRRKIARFAYVPYGPVVNWTLINQGGAASNTSTNNPESILVIDFFKQFKEFAKNYIREKHITLLRFDAILDKEYRQGLVELGFVKSLAPTQAKDTWVLDISQLEADLKKGMADTNRNMINRGVKYGIEVIHLETKVMSQELKEAYLKAFYELLTQTTSRKGFVTYPYDYFKKQYEELNPRGMTEIFLARHEGKYLAGALMNYYKDTVYYSHAGSLSDRELSKLGAPYFLIWNIILDAKERGFKKLNFWGALPKEIASHQLRGVSDFKMKFGGKGSSLVGAFEVYNNPARYLVHRLADWWVYRNDRY